LAPSIDEAISVGDLILVQYSKLAGQENDYFELYASGLHRCITQNRRQCLGDPARQSNDTHDHSLLSATSIVDFTLWHPLIINKISD
ncbi:MULTISPECIES: hypothetical protein, partial [unclassified Shewanella]|uniref:hypothetical protein n=1 Tax=unclassified Shewanella TaxID=196818 RepID=UPI000CB06A36